MIIYVDIDNTICKTVHTNYSTATPLLDKIMKINSLYDQGHTIVYWTARGAKSKIDYYNLSYNQLIAWGVKFHQLLCNKPAYDLFIDDKTLSSIDDIKI